MTEPQIARRCSSCGVSIREAALFCPQCGVALPQQSFERTNPFLAATLEDTIYEPAPTIAVEQVELGNDSPSESTGNSPNESPVESSEDSAANPTTEAAVEVPAIEPVKVSTGQTALGTVGTQIHRATSLARNVEGGVVHGAQKMRKISGVVIDEAAYDPSLRFVLVAAVLFILFLVIVLLNKFIV